MLYKILALLLVYGMGSLTLSAQQEDPPTPKPLALSEDSAPTIRNSLATFRFPSKGLTWVRLTGDFLKWDRRGLELHREGDYFQGTFQLEPNKVYRYKYITSGDTMWCHDPANPEVERDTYGGFNSLLRIDDQGNRIPAKNTLPFDREKRSPHFILRYQSSRLTDSLAAGYLENLERGRNGIIQAFLGLNQGVEPCPTGHLTPECLEIYNELKYPEIPEVVELWLLNPGTRSNDQGVMAAGPRMLNSQGRTFSFAKQATLASSLSGCCSSSMGKFGLSMALAARSEGMTPQEMQVLNSTRETWVRLAKADLLKGDPITVMELMDQPEETFFARTYERVLRSNVMNFALFEYLLANYSGPAVLCFARTLSLEGLGVSSYQELESGFYTWLKDQ